MSVGAADQSAQSCCPDITTDEDIVYASGPSIIHQPISKDTPHNSAERSDEAAEQALFPKEDLCSKLDPLSQRILMSYLSSQSPTEGSGDKETPSLTTVSRKFKPLLFKVSQPPAEAPSKDAIREQEMNALRVWQDLDKKWKADDITLQPSDRTSLKRVVRAGIPSSLRGVIWPWLINSTHLYSLNEDAADESIYETLLGFPVDEPVVSQIGKDIGRTFPKSGFFKSHNELKLLFRILKAYAAHDPSIQYCQGMNMSASLFLFYISDERQAYWCFYRYMMLYGDMYTKHLRGTLIRAKALGHLLQRVFPDIHAYLQGIGVDMILLAPNWFMTSFSYALNHDIALRMFDCLLCEGEKILYRAALAIFKMAAQGRMLPTPSKESQEQYFARFHEPYPWEKTSTSYTVYYDAWIEDPDNAGTVSLLCMPMEHALRYLTAIPPMLKNSDGFIETCLSIKFTTVTLNQCRKLAEAEMN